MRPRGPQAGPALYRRLWRLSGGLMNCACRRPRIRLATVTEMLRKKGHGVAVAARPTIGRRKASVSAPCSGRPKSCPPKLLRTSRRRLLYEAGSLDLARLIARLRRLSQVQDCNSRNPGLACSNQGLAAVKRPSTVSGPLRVRRVILLRFSPHQLIVERSQASRSLRGCREQQYSMNQATPCH